MVSFRISLLIIIIYIIAVVLFAANAFYNYDIICFNSHDNPIINNTSINNISLGNDSTNAENLVQENLILPSQEFILQNINWSNYTLLQNPYFHNYEISDPTDIVNHQFLYVVIVVEINDGKNRLEILKQLSGVVLEQRSLLGPNSGPTVWGTVDGICIYYAALRPYETEVCARYLP